MATSLDQVNAERAVDNNKGKKFPSDDVELAVNLGVKVLNEGNGLQLIEKAINQSQDPAQVIDAAGKAGEDFSFLGIRCEIDF